MGADRDQLLYRAFISSGRGRQGAEMCRAKYLAGERACPTFSRAPGARAAVRPRRHHAEDDSERCGEKEQRGSEQAERAVGLVRNCGSAASRYSE